LTKTLTKVLALKHKKASDIVELLNSQKNPVILVMKKFSPTDVTALEHPKLAALIIEEGVPTEHVCLKLGSTGKPGSIMPGFLSKVNDGDLVIIDGINRTAIINPIKETQEHALKKIEQNETIFVQLKSFRGQSVVVKGDSEEVKLLVNADDPNLIEDAIKNGVDGTSLVRTEWFFMNRQNGMEREKIPKVDEQISYYNKIMDASGGKPVTFRILDLNGKDKKLPYYSVSEEAQGLGLLLDKNSPYNTALESQIDAFLLSKVELVMLPNVTSLDEVNQFLDIFEKRKERLAGSGHSINENLKLGVMYENPAVNKDLEKILKKTQIHFVSIGSNDLTSKTLGIDRYNLDFAKLLAIAHFHPKVIKNMEFAIDLANRAGKDISICGDLASNWMGVLLLAAIGMKKMGFSNYENADVARKLLLSVDRESLNEMMTKTVRSSNEASAIHSDIKHFTLDMIEDGRWDLEDIKALLFKEP